MDAGDPGAVEPLPRSTSSRSCLISSRSCRTSYSSRRFCSISRSWSHCPQPNCSWEKGSRTTILSLPVRSLCVLSRSPGLSLELSLAVLSLPVIRGRPVLSRTVLSLPVISPGLRGLSRPGRSRPARWFFRWRTRWRRCLNGGRFCGIHVTNGPRPCGIWVRGSGGGLGLGELG